MDCLVLVVGFLLVTYVVYIYYTYVTPNYNINIDFAVNCWALGLTLAFILLYLLPDYFDLLIWVIATLWILEMIAFCYILCCIISGSEGV